jgi:hypothetical protein
MNSIGQIVISGNQVALFELSSSSFLWSIENDEVFTLGLVLGYPDTAYVANFAVYG